MLQTLTYNVIIIMYQRKGGSEFGRNKFFNLMHFITSRKPFGRVAVVLQGNKRIR